MKRSPMRSRPARNPLPREQRDAALTRDGYQCQAERYGWITATRCTPGVQVHHIRGRGMGSSSDPSVHDLSNLVTLCPVHHAEVESRRADAYACGLAERRNR